ncbi:hypothetical protein HanIR_Chr06g0294761 [Helianthus annuus]|nr:hypothetical protein HanIR_Chr06g0294761 [Helianthus annuus]
MQNLVSIIIYQDSLAIDQDTHRRTWALVAIKDARLVNYVILLGLFRHCNSVNQ